MTNNVNGKAAYNLAWQAAAWGYALMEMYRQREIRTAGPNPAGTNAPLNEFGHAEKLVTAEWTSGLYPNSDTLYSMATLDLSEEPMVLNVPDVDRVGKMDERYYVLPFYDGFNRVFFSIGSGSGKHEGTYLIAGPRWTGECPEGLIRIDTPTDYVYIAGRTLVDGEDDIKNVHAIQDGYRLTPLSKYHGGPGRKPTGFPAGTGAPPYVEMPEGIEFFRGLASLMQRECLGDREIQICRAFEKIGLSTNPETPFNPSLADKEVMEQALDDLYGFFAENPLGEVHNGWKYVFDAGYWLDYLVRGQGAWEQLAFANVPEEGFYPKRKVDVDGHVLHGDHQYVMHFESPPPVEAFWSVAMYKAEDENPVENELGRLSISDRTPGVVINDDKSMSIYIQADPPAEGKSNWLPAPPEKEFVLVLRTYLPGKDILDLTYLLPEVERVG